jgi:hypothetical protein
MTALSERVFAYFFRNGRYEICEVYPGGRFPRVMVTTHNQDEAKFITEALSAYQEQSADVVAEAATT